MKQNRQSGHAVLITVTIILAVAIVGLVGWIFWHNFINKPTPAPATTTSSTATTATSTELTQSATATYGGKTLTIKYPASWRDVKDGTSGAGITSPDGNIIIRYTLTPPNGIGGTCGDPSDPITDPVKYSLWEAIPGTSDAVFGSYINEYLKSDSNPTAYYSYDFAAMSNVDAVKNVQTGDSACPHFIFADFVEVPGGSGATLHLYAVFKSLYNDDLSQQRQDTTLKEIQDTITSADAQIAQKIIESITIK